MTRPNAADQPDPPTRPNDTEKNRRVEESEIDQILADSFPASDAPPWTLGVTETPPKTVERKGT